MCPFILAILAISCTLGGLALRNIGTSFSNITFMIYGATLEIPQEIVEYGQNAKQLGTALFVIGLIGLLYTFYFVNFRGRK